MSTLYKYPRTPHLPYSEGASLDDIHLLNDDLFLSMVQVVITEKLDGENTTMYEDHIHSRSLDGRSHPSMSYVKNIWGSIRNSIPPGYRICGENMYATHSIHYNELESFFYVFSVWRNDTCLSLDETLTFCEALGLNFVPILYIGKYNREISKSLFTGKSKLGGEQEGFVVRNTEEFLLCDFSNNIAKFVRKNHVQTEEHWKQKIIIPNELTKK